MNTAEKKIGAGALPPGGTPTNCDAGYHDDGTGTCVKDSPGGGGGGGGGGGKGNLCPDGVTYDYGDPAANCPQVAPITQAKGMPKWLKWGLALVAVGGAVAFGWIWWSNREVTSSTYLLATETRSRKGKPRKGRKKK